MDEMSTLYSSLTYAEPSGSDFSESLEEHCMDPLEFLFDQSGSVENGAIKVDRDDLGYPQDHYQKVILHIFYIFT
jgi:hypothetical protein